MAAFDIQGRVARQRLALAVVLGEDLPDGSSRIPLRITHSDLAALVGPTRVRVNVVLVGFTRRGLISIDRRHRITIYYRAELDAPVE
jgi:CRP-like cAMP-binding protein